VATLASEHLRAPAAGGSPEETYAHLTPDDVERMTYVQFISLLRETNRCPGGKQTILAIARTANLHAGSRILDIGCNTGFTSLELAKVTPARIIGVDVVPEAIVEAVRWRDQLPHSIADRVEFIVGNALDLPFPDERFDLVVVGGATSFIERKYEAVAEYTRVLVPYGLLSVTNLIYREPPPQEVIDGLSEIIGVPIEPYGCDDWMRIFLSTGLEVYAYEERELAARPPEIVERYVVQMVDRPHLAVVPAETIETIRSRLLETMLVFNENHRYLGYMRVFLRRDVVPEQPELFIEAGARDWFFEPPVTPDEQD